MWRRGNCWIAFNSLPLLRSPLIHRLMLRSRRDCDKLIEAFLESLCVYLRISVACGCI